MANNSPDKPVEPAPDDTPAPRGDAPPEEIVPSEMAVPPAAVEEAAREGFLERLRAEEALHTLDRVSRASGLKFTSRRQNATEQFSRGIQNAIKKRMDRPEAKEEASLETSPEPPAPQEEEPESVPTTPAVSPQQ